jgi:hypothetical protein
MKGVILCYYIITYNMHKLHWLIKRGERGVGGMHGMRTGMSSLIFDAGYQDAGVHIQFVANKILNLLDLKGT